MVLRRAGAQNIEMEKHMDLAQLHSAVRAMADGQDVSFEGLGSAERRALYRVAGLVRAAGSLEAVTPPAKSTVWAAPPR